MRFPKLRINTNWLLLGVAVLLGTGAVMLSHSLLQRRMAELEQAAHRGEDFEAVVVASRDLERGDTITSDVVAVRKIPKAYVHQAAVRPGEFGNFERQRLAVPLKRGEALLPAYTEGNGQNVFSATLKKGWRALTFEVDAVNSISGMLRPGDRIDLIYSAKGSAGGEDTTLPLLSNVSVLATDQQITKRDEVTGKERTFSTITLEVTPVDADRIIVAKASGTLTAVLRHPDDTAANATRRLTALNLVGGGTGGERSVEYIVGGNAKGFADVQMARLASPVTSGLATPGSPAAAPVLH